MLADMPGGALQDLMQALRPVIGLDGFAAGFVGLALPPRCDPLAHAPPVGGKRRGRGHVLGPRDFGRQPLAEDLAAGDFEKRLRDPEHVMRQDAVLSRPVRHLDIEPVIGHQRDDLQGRADKPVEALDQLCRRQDRPGLLVELQEFDDLRDVLRKDKFVAARQDRDRACAEALQFGSPGGVFQHIDRLELDPTDREKLLESQAAGSARLPERLQGRGLGHRGAPRERRLQLRSPPPQRQPPPQHPAAKRRSACRCCRSCAKIAGRAGSARRKPWRCGCGGS